MIRPEFREAVSFLAQDVRNAMPEEPFHLILCRYLAFTYFDALLQDKTLRQLVERIQVGGALMIREGESLPCGEFSLIPWSQKEGVYRRVSTALAAT